MPSALCSLLGTGALAYVYFPLDVTACDSDIFSACTRLKYARKTHLVILGKCIFQGCLCRPHAQVAALVAFIGVRDPQKQDMIRVRGTPALVIAGCAFVAGLMSLVCSLYNLGAIEMMMIQLVFNGAVFRYLWNGAVGPSNALVYGDYNTGLDNSDEYMYIV